MGDVGKRKSKSSVAELVCGKGHRASGVLGRTVRTLDNGRVGEQLFARPSEDSPLGLPCVQVSWTKVATASLG